MATKARHAQTNGGHGNMSIGEWSFYVIWVASLVGEGFIVQYLMFLAHKMAPSVFAMWIAMFLFFVGLTGISLLYFFVITKRGEKMHGFLRWISKWIDWPRGWDILGFILGTLLGSSIGLAQILKAEYHGGSTSANVKDIVFSAAIFSLAWVPVFVLV